MPASNLGLLEWLAKKQDAINVLRSIFCASFFMDLELFVYGFKSGFPHMFTFENFSSF
jgi:hypothetical protein